MKSQQLAAVTAQRCPLPFSWSIKEPTDLLPTKTFTFINTEQGVCTKLTFKRAKIRILFVFNPDVWIQSTGCFRELFGLRWELWCSYCASLLVHKHITLRVVRTIFFFYALATRRAILQIRLNFIRVRRWDKHSSTWLLFGHGWFNLSVFNLPQC